MTIAPYQQQNVRRFGDFVYDLTAPLETIEARLDIDDDDETGEELSLSLYAGKGRVTSPKRA